MGLTAVTNYCIVQIEKRYQDKDGQFTIDTTWEPQEFATLEGIVISAPIRVENDRHRTVLGQVAAGDKVFFGYGVVYNYEKQPDNDTPVYRNLILHEGQEYWKVDLGEVFCRIMEDGKTEMVTDNVLLEPFPVKHNTDNDSGLILPKKDTSHLGIVKAVPPNYKLSVRVGDTVCFEPRFIQHYNILGKEHYITPARRIIAKV